MLTVARKRNECVMVLTPAGTLRVIVTRIKPGRDGGEPRAWLAFQAPLDWTILRGELWKGDD